jgi:hypothetical protein
MSLTQSATVRVLARLPLSLAFLAAFLAGPTVPLQAAPQLSVSQVTIQRADGQVVFTVTKDAILAATVAASAQTGATPLALQPTIVPLGSGRIAVLMGAIGWTESTAGKSMRLDAELPPAARAAMQPASGESQPDLAGDIEAIGVTILELLRPMVREVHTKLDLATDEPLVQVLLAGYAEGYGPEIWSLSYRVQQRNLGNDYWDTRPLRPAYTQLYPPEKGQPHTFVEVQYPPKAAPLGLLRATQSDSRVQRIRASSEQTNEALTAILNGESRKASSRPTADFIRAAIPLLAGEQARLAIAALDERYRFQWILAPEDALAPPPETETQQEQPPSQQRQTERPSLRRAAPPSDR